MTAYVLVDIEVTDVEGYEDCKKISAPAVVACGGKYLARGGKFEVLEGDWTPKRLVILEFETVDKAKAWLVSPEYGPARELRHKYAKTNMVVVEGV
jgi:uncharacterized protein (DUF1330 family)